MRTLAWFFFSLVLLGCGSDGGPVGPGSHLVGAACSDDHHCEARCARGKHYPGGMCTVSCRDDRDCPGGTFCVSDHGGICALSCGHHRDCDFMGPRYACDSHDRKGAPGRAHVCRVP